MPTQRTIVFENKVSRELKKVSRDENIPVEELAEKIKKGTVCIPKNRKHKVKPVGIGEGLSTKTNANIGTSQDCTNFRYELKKLKAAVEYGADTVMDLSTGGNIRKIRKLILEKSTVPVGTVPIYEAATILTRKEKETTELSPSMMFDVIEEQAEEGVDFITVHCGVTIQVLEKLKKEKRKLNIVSRGGSILAEWIEHNNKENFLYSDFDRLLKIAKKYDVTISLGDGLRPGCLSDATDRAQIEELIVLGELTKRAWSAGVQVMIEGPGHVPLNAVEMNVRIQKELCHNAPFYVLGPIVTDIAPGYDHITSSIGGAVAAGAGADFLCYVTPAEHLSLPTVDDVKLGVISARIAAHSGDIAKGIKKAVKLDDKMAAARNKLDWENQIKYSIDPLLVRKIRNANKSKDSEVCTMCSEFCAIKKMNKIYK